MNLRGHVNLAADSTGGEVAPDQAGQGDPNGPRPASVRLLLFAAARQAAGTGREEVAGATVGEVLEGARRRFGQEFSAVLDGSRVWVNGEPADASTALSEGDEVAVLPPVSGGVR